MYRLTVSNGMEIDTSDYPSVERAREAMESSFKGMGDADMDMSYLGAFGAFHQGEEECNIFSISEIPDDIKQMSFKQILDEVSDDTKRKLYQALKREFDEELEEGMDR